MRLRRLELTRYGRFTDRCFDFGGRGDGPDLHVIYGPNEAGKSTLCNGFLDLLYGIPGQSAYGFLHPYSTMRIAAVLDFDGAEREVVRIKKPSNSLLDVAGAVLPEAVVSGPLGGIGRDAYRVMFSLDDDSLENGGKAILDSRGDLGELLFSASAGLADLSRRLVDAKAVADGFYRFRAHSGGLQEMKARLTALKAEREAIDMGALEYVRLVETLDAVSSRYADAVSARGRTQARLETIGASLGALPRLVALRDLRERLSPLLALPMPPVEWSEAAPILSKEAVELIASAAAMDAEIERLTYEAESCTLDEPVLAAEHRLRELAKLRPRAETAEQDLPRSRAAIREEDLAIAGFLTRIGKPGESDPSRLVLSIQAVSTLRNAMEAHSGIIAALEAARVAQDVAGSKLAQARLLLSQGGAAIEWDSHDRDAALAELDAAARAAQASDHGIRCRAAERAAAAANEELARRSRAFDFAGEAADLSFLQIPTPDAIAAWKVIEAKLDAEDLLIAAEDERLSSEILRLDAERQVLSRAGALASDRQIAAARAERERAWAAHRAALCDATAEAFETAMRRDDLVAAARVEEATERARLRQLDEARELTSSMLSSLVKERERQAERRAMHAVELASAGRRSGMLAPHGEDGVTALETWLVKRKDFLIARTSLDEARRQGREAVEDGERLTLMLREALGHTQVSSGPAEPFEQLLARARACLDAGAEAKRLRAAVLEKEGECRDRRESFAKAQIAERDWAAAWKRVCSSCFLGEGGVAPPLDVVRETLIELALLGPALERRAGWADRVGKMERDVELFAREVAAVAKFVGESSEGASALVLADGLTARLTAAVATRNSLTRLAKAQEEVKQRRRAIAELLDLNKRRRAEMAEFFGVANAFEVEAALAAVTERTKLEKEARVAEKEILDLLGLDDLSRAEADLDGIDREALIAERAELKVRLEDEDKRCHELFAAMTTASERVEAVGGDAKVAAIESKRRTVLMEIEEGALRYLRLRAGVAAMDQALRLYKETHRGSMLAKASDAFVTMSGGAYSGLRTQPWKDRETLIAVSRDGSSKEADQLSKGTRFQLYLSLRAAGYLEYAAVRTPPPFVADDIMETFDDFRAEEALKIFARMAEVGQVVYLTHHRHLLPIARDVCPGVKIHSLGATELSAA